MASPVTGGVLQRFRNLATSAVGPIEGRPSYIEKVHGRLSALETETAKKAKVGDILDYAITRPSELITTPFKGTIRGQGDALRHILLSAELHRTNPDIADLLLVGHEFQGTLLGSQSLEELQQDIQNNRIGKEIGRTAKSRKEVEELSMKALSKATILTGAED